MSAGEDRDRRALYTFWRRTMPYPLMTNFDAPTRDVCVSRRLRTNTPLQALQTMNDQAFTTCAQTMARRILTEGGTDIASRVRFAWRSAVSRTPTAAEAERVAAFVADETARFQRDEARAMQVANAATKNEINGASTAELAAWTMFARALLNTDEALTKE